jgi:hypothetical protein
VTAGKASTRTRPPLDRRLLFAVGALLAASLFLVESGLAEILLARDRRCLEAVRALRVAPARGSTCYSVETRALVQGMSGVGLRGAGSEGGLGRWGMVGLYAVLGGVCALSGRRGLVTFLALHAVILAGSSILAYFSNFVILSR